jgi:hypothetical protein
MPLPAPANPRWNPVCAHCIHEYMNELNSRGRGACRHRTGLGVRHGPRPRRSRAAAGAGAGGGPRGRGAVGSAVQRAQRQHRRLA